MASLPLGNDPEKHSEAFEKRREANRAALKAEIDRAVQEAQARMRKRTPEEQARLNEFLKWAMTERKPLTPGPHPTAEEMIREDRER